MKTLVLFFHPNPKNSVRNKIYWRHLKTNVTVRIVDDSYLLKLCDVKVVAEEQQLLL